MGGNVMFGRQVTLADGDPQGLFERDFEPVEQLVDANLQSRVFMHQRIANQHPRQPPVFLGKAQQQGEHHLYLSQAVFFLGGDLVNDGKEAGFDEFDQPLEHLRLAGEMTIQCRFRDVDPFGQCGGGDFLGSGILQHFCDDLQNL